MTWKPELEEIARRTELAKQMGGEKRVGRARAAGRLPVRERIDLLLDAGSFHETAALAGVYGVAGAGQSDPARGHLRSAWPSGEWGSLPIEGGVEAAYKRQLEASAEPEKLRAKLEAQLASLRDPLLTAEVFGVEEIIDPRETRPLLVEFARRAIEIVGSENGPKRRGMRP